MSKKPLFNAILANTSPDKSNKMDRKIDMTTNSDSDSEINIETLSDIKFKSSVEYNDKTYIDKTNQDLSLSSQNVISNIDLEELMELIKSGEKSLLMIKLKHYSSIDGFNIDIQNEYGNTLLHTACRIRDYDIVKTLLEIYNARVDIQNADGRTPLHIATIYGSTDKALYTLHNGGTKQITNSSDIINLIVDKYPHSLFIRDKDNMTPMNYFNTHSDITTNKSLNKRYKSYKRNIAFFDSLKTVSSDINDYELSISIYYALKNAA